MSVRQLPAGPAKRLGAGMECVHRRRQGRAGHVGCRPSSAARVKSSRPPSARFRTRSTVPWPQAANIPSVVSADQSRSTGILSVNRWKHTEQPIAWGWFTHAYLYRYAVSKAELASAVIATCKDAHHAPSLLLVALRLHRSLPSTPSHWALQLLKRFPRERH